MILPQDLARRSLYLFALVLTLLIAAAGGAPARSADASIASVGIGDGQTLSGSVTWTAQVSGTPNRVDFAIDGTTRWTEHHSPYTYGGDGNKLDTSTLADGPHTFTVTAYPTAGKGRSVEASVSATVSNAGSTPSTVGPASIGAPTISGTVAVGQALTASNGSWTGTAPLAYAYEWHLCDTSGSSCTVPAGATDSTFVVPTAAGGSTVKVEVTASNIAGSASAFSAATAVVPSDGSSSGSAPSPAGSPSISGSSVVGQTLTASPGTWDGTTPMGYGYQWQQCGSGGGSCSPIAGATGKSYVVASGLVGSTLRVEVTATNSVGSASASSPATAAVGSGGSSSSGSAPSPSGPITISGSAVVGQTLTASFNSWDGTTPISYTYQWQHCDASGSSCNPIASATSKSFVVTSGLVGNTLQVTVTATNSVGSNSTDSATSAVVTSVPWSTQAPSISGSSVVGQTLTASPGTWDGTTPMGYGYQWQQCGSGGGSCSPIAGATGKSYVVATGLVGSTLRVEVTATNSVGSASASSAATAVVASVTGSSTFASKTAYLDAPLPDLSNAITVSSASAFNAAVANAKAGQTINVLGNVQIPGKFTGFNRVISGGTVNVVFQPGAGFTGMAGTRLPAVWIKGSGGWRIWGGTITNPDGNGILVYAMPGPFVWTGFRVSNTGDTCVAVYPVDGNINGLTLKGVAGTADPNLSFDPHAEKGTGIHAWNIADASGGLVQNSTFAADTLDQATGAAVEIKTGQIGANVTVFARAKHLGFPLAGTTWNGYATQQTAGNVIQLWGTTVNGNLNVKYAEGNGIQGRILETGGMYGGASLANAYLDYGTATGLILESPLVSKIAYNARDGIHLGDVSPTP